MDELEDPRLVVSDIIASRPKSAKRAWPVPSIRILALKTSIGVGK